MLLAIDVALVLHRSVNDVVEILARLIVRCDDECRVWVCDVLGRNRPQALLARADFVNAALLVKPFDGTPRVSTRQLLNDRLQLWILLPYNLVKMSRTDPRLLELVIGPSGIDGFVLARVADKQHAVV
jgi:hypothetical protein